MLQDMPEDVIQSTLRRVHLTPLDPESMLRALATANNPIPLNSPPSPLAGAQAILPKVSSQVELELLMRHPRAYPTLDLSEDGVMANKIIIGSHSSKDSTTPEPNTPRSDVLSQISTHDAFGFDTRLQGLDIAFWTTVNITDEYAKGAGILAFAQSLPVLTKYFLQAQYLSSSKLITRPLAYSMQICSWAILLLADWNFAPHY